jgi:hypothetical protein
VHRFPRLPFFFFFLGLREAESSAVSSFHFPLVLGKMAPTTSSPVAKLVAISRSLLSLVGDLRPNSWTSSLQVVPAMNAPMTSESVTLGSLVHCLAKHRMNSWRVSPRFWQ